MDLSRREALLAEYGEVANNFRMLTDIRFKLLALLPIAAAVAVATLSNRATVPGLAISLFGLVVTLGVVTYNARNNQLYNELVGRAASIERSLGLGDGGFAHRPRAWLTIDLLGRKWKVDHETGVGTIYKASIVLWLFGVFAPVLELARQAYVNLGLWFPPYVSSKYPLIWVYLAAISLAVLITYRATKAIEDQKEKRSKAMRKWARDAVQKATPLDLRRIADDEDFIRLCGQLLGEGEEKVRARLRFYAALDPDSLNHYLPPRSDKLSASLLVALLTDLPPQWIFDCATNRKGTVPDSESHKHRSTSSTTDVLDQEASAEESQPGHR